MPSPLKSSASVRFRLSLVVVVSVFAGILITTSVFLVNDFRQAVAAERARLSGSTAAFAAALSKSVETGDRAGALQVMRGISRLPHVTYVAVTDRNGRVFAEIGGGVSLIGRDGSLDDAGILSMFMAESMDVSAPIVQGGRDVGRIVFKAETGWLRTRYLHSFLFSIGAGLGIMILTAFAAQWNIRRILRPLSQLSSAFLDIRETSDLTHRLAKTRDDEVGVLVDAFNDMFSRIDERDRALRRSNETLEETVDIRTSELTIAKELAERANAAKSDFLSTMSHEIRTPMNGIMVMAEMLAAAPLAPKHQRFAEIITRSGRGLLNIINDILDLSKIESGRMELESIPFSPETVIEDAASLFAERASEKHLTLATCIAPDVPDLVAGDPTRFGQIISNLVNNALKFTEAGGVVVDVTRSGEAVEVHVRDSGIGIAADKIGGIFERFTQADQTITRKFGGTGLGLSITRRLVEAMDGEIGVASAPGQGSDFWFRVRLPTLQEHDAPPLARPMRAVVAIEPALAGEAVRRMLTLRGVEMASDPALAAGADLILADAAAARRLFDMAGDAADGLPLVLARAIGEAGEWTSSGIPVDAPVVDLPLRRRDVDLLLRCAAERNFAPIRHSSASDNVSAALPSFPGVRVLAVDDNAVNREVLGEALSSLGIRPDMADSGPAAIERVAASSYDIIFMDCSMPGMDGFEATRRIRSDEARLGRDPAFVVALTAHVTGPEARRWVEAGMDTHVAKPFTIARLVEAIASAGKGSSVPLPPPVGVATIGASDDVPLLAPETLTMFATLSGAAGGAMAKRIFSLFARHAPKAIDDIARGGDDPVVVAQLAHAMKSMCASAGAARAAALCGTIEDEAKTGGLPSQATIARLNSVFEETRKAMDRHLAALDAAATPISVPAA